MQYPCRKCLLREMDQNAYLVDLRSYIDNMDSELKAEQAVYEDRLALCKQCDYLNEGLCRACGCFVELRAVVERNRCPYEKW